MMMARAVLIFRQLYVDGFSGTTSRRADRGVFACASSQYFGRMTKKKRLTRGIALGLRTAFQ